jgi:hypothetical protein
MLGEMLTGLMGNMPGVVFGDMPSGIMGDMLTGLTGDMPGGGIAFTKIKAVSNEAHQRRPNSKMHGLQW